MTYKMDVMRRLEWDLHNTIEMTGRVPAEWHEIATATPRAEKMKVNLMLEADVVRFFKSMAAGYGPRINEVLKSYMHARLAGVILGCRDAEPLPAAGGGAGRPETRLWRVGAAGGKQLDGRRASAGVRSAGEDARGDAAAIRRG